MKEFKGTPGKWKYRHNGDREGMRVCLNLSRVEVLNQRYFLGPCPF